MKQLRRTHTCGELREEHVGQTVVVSGWVNTARNHNIFVFADLRDRYGVTQLVFEPDRGKELFAAAEELRAEWVIAVQGTVVRRQPENENRKIPSGLIEIKAEEIQILNRCPTPPFAVAEKPDDELANEDLRLQYRYLDLRRPSLQRTLMMRHRLNKVIRDYLDARGFLELETPLLGRSSPEGARDYLVPSRVSPGAWYALPQSPQLYKQLLMVAGYDKYFQIARCLRDEDLRADRQPEFTQLDVEMSFIEQEDVFELVEGLTTEIFGKCLGMTVGPIQRLKYADALLRYGSDKPDLRFGLEIVDIGDLASQTEFPLFKDSLAAGGKVRGLNVKGAAEKFSRKALDELAEQVKQLKGKVLAWVKVEADKLGSSIAKFLTPAIQQGLREKFAAQPGDLLLLVAADAEVTACQALGGLRTLLASKLGLVDPAKKEFKIAWILDFPSFIWDDEEKRWAANHHPFTAPRDEDLARLESDPGSVTAKAYDLVINGYEVGGGSIRIHNPEVQSRLFKVLGMSEEQARARFGFLLDALRYGAPPHGGVALGLDRWAMMLAGTTNIRDVIAFPKNQKARDLMTGAPAPVDAKQLKELGL
jgi:aspartyl-tRNA synthetase